MDEIETLAHLETATDEALELADELASMVASGAACEVRRKAAEVAANYLQVRVLMRRLRALRVEVAV